jgi:dimethylamine monooxygenase subunit A
VRIPDGQNLPFDPFDGKAFRLRIGARPLDPSAWIVLDERTEDELDQKVVLLTQSREQFATCVTLPKDPLSIAAAEELCAAIETHLRTYEPTHLALANERIDRYRNGQDLGPFIDPIVRAGLLTQEDWCVLVQQSPEEPLLLTAGTLCFPNRWRLSDKIGLPMLGIHTPVPQYGEEVGAPTNSLLSRLTPDRPVWRMNWGIADNPALHQPTGHFDPNAGSRVLDIGADVVLRIERQTLIRLPNTGAVVFGIRTIVRTLNEVLRSDPTVAPRMATALETLPEDMRAYKSLNKLGPLVSTWLRAQPTD